MAAVAVHPPINKMKTKTLTYVRSMAFAKNVVRSAISNICYLRCIFDDHVFMDRTLEGVQIKALRPSVNDNADTLISWVEEGAFDALERGYLREISLGVHLEKDRPHNIVEQYAFQINYTNGVPSLSLSTNLQDISNKIPVQSDTSTIDDIKAQTMQLLRTLIVLTQTLTPLPNKHFFSMRLLYLDNVTPPEYEPKHFISGSDVPFSFLSKPVTIKVGKIYTPFHQLKMRVSVENGIFNVPPISSSSKTIESGTYSEVSKRSHDPDIATSALHVTEKVPGNDGEISKNDSPLSTISKCLNKALQEEVPPEVAPMEGPSFIKTPDQDLVKRTQLKSINQSTSVVDTTPVKVTESKSNTCLCGSNAKAGLTNKLTCSKCHIHVHQKCSNVWKVIPIDSEYICDLCSSAPKTDIQFLTMMRQTIRILSDMACRKITVTFLRKKLGCTHPVALRILNAIQVDEFIQEFGISSKPKGVTRIVVEDVTSVAAFQNYFQTQAKKATKDVIPTPYPNKRLFNEDVLAVDIESSQESDFMNLYKRHKKSSITARSISVEQ